MREIEILIVTSDEWWGAGLDAALQREGVTCRIAIDPAAAIRCLVEDRPAVVALDATYPMLDPLRLARRARACVAYAAPAILVLESKPGACDPWLAGAADAVLDRAAPARELAQRIAAALLPV